MLESAIHGLKPFLGRLLERSLNNVLMLDPDRLRLLLRLEGRCIQVRCTAPPFALQVRVSDQRLYVGPVDKTGDPDLSVRGSWHAFIQPMLTRLVGSETVQPYAHGQVHLSGDAALAQQLQRIVAQFDPDWQRPWTRVFGDVFGVMLANQVQMAFKQAQTHMIACAHNIADYLTEESRDIVSATECEELSAAIAKLESDVNQCVERYQQRYRQKARL